ncbi:hypothetical protein ASPBRDRAFT_46504 [Aspergillus brasiliensis CBS 101740]|uniref:Uncharacterized protein n=1 Tax=Aspergillus brasiliensis (strain CBS 101740 / IMI 381727 / IBT 21946) TaxID=767769 RepID=A0A1L9UC07_ASPBC|nr:hypothetical protein ASPBRDRAFT_46504 [Aspergillus brasiliensis CBS 101740]
MVAHLANPNRPDRDSTWGELATLGTGLILSSLLGTVVRIQLFCLPKQHVQSPES